MNKFKRHFQNIIIYILLCINWRKRVIFSAPFWGWIRTRLTDSLRKHGKSIFLCLKTNLPPCSRNCFHIFPKKYKTWQLYFLWRYKLGHLDISFRTNFWQGVSENVILADFETRVQLGHIGKFQLSFSKWTISSLDGRLVYIYLWIIVWYIWHF